MAPRAATVLAAALAAAVAVALGALRATPEMALFRGPRPFSPFLGWPAPVFAFESLGQGLFRADMPWWVTPFHKETLDVFAIDLGGGRWALSDAGGFDTPLQRHATALHGALRELMGADGTLALVLLTHGHLDHVGALPLLLRAYPACRVVYHEAETAFLIDGAPWTPHWWRSGVYSPGFVLAHVLGFFPRAQYALPASRGVALRGSSGELSALGAPGLKWHHLPGHAPSHVAYVHGPSRTLLAGDLADFLLDPPGVEALPDGRVLLRGQPAMYTLTIFAGADAQQARRSLCRVAYDKGIAFERVRFAHDATKSAHSRAELQPLAEAAAQCNGKF